MTQTMLVVIALFFVIGIAVGIIAVIAISAYRAHGRPRPGDFPRYGADGFDHEPPDAGPDSRPGTGQPSRPWDIRI
jgi:hypothetical protein